MSINSTTKGANTLRLLGATFGRDDRRSPEPTVRGRPGASVTGRFWLLVYNLRRTVWNCDWQVMDDKSHLSSPVMWSQPVLLWRNVGNVVEFDCIINYSRMYLTAPAEKWKVSELRISESYGKNKMFYVTLANRQNYFYQSFCWTHHAMTSLPW